MSPWILLAALASAPPTGETTAEPTPAGDETAEAPVGAAPTDPDPYTVQAPLDVETLLVDNGRGYLDAWGRLEGHPTLAAEAILDRLAAIPALGPARRKRLLDILAGLKKPEHVPLFAKELRRAVVQADDLPAAEAAANRWRALLSDQGEAAAPHLQKLVGDRELPLRIRAALVEDLVKVTPTARADGLVVLIGRGHPDLRRALRSAMVDWAKRDETAAESMRAASDAALGEIMSAPDPSERGTPRTTGLVWFRSHIAATDDTAFVKRLSEIVRDEGESFAFRVAATRGLGQFESGRARKALVVLARDQLSAAKRSTQRGEVLGWIALRQLPAERARPVADELKLAEADAPRLATLGYDVGSVGSAAPWLERGLGNPWPQVRQAALARVDTPCSDVLVDRLADLGGPARKGGDDDGAAARSATQALGRCGGSRAQTHLVKQLKNDNSPMEQRAEAARQLTKHGGEDGVDAVAKVLGGDVTRALARRLAGALRFASAPTDRATRVLCERLEDGGEVARAAAISLRKLHRGGNESPCSG